MCVQRQAKVSIVAISGRENQICAEQFALVLGGQVAYFGDTEDNGDWFTGADAADDGDIGWELDIGVNINIYKNLTLNGGFGYLIAGDALNSPSTYGADPDANIADPWLFCGALVYSF